MLYVLPTNTWNAYNTWGGQSLYTGGSVVSFHRPFARGMLCRPDGGRDDRKARPTRFGEASDFDGRIFQQYRTDNNYPSAIGSTGWFTYGRRFVEWAEADDWQFDMCVNSDLENDPVRPGPITGLLAEPSVGEPEWTLLGAGSAFGLYHRLGKATPDGVGGYIISRPEHWLLADTEIVAWVPASNVGLASIRRRSQHSAIRATSSSSLNESSTTPRTQ